MNWLANQNTSSQYASLVKIENAIGQKHAILLHAKQKDHRTEITLIDSFSKEDSMFKIEIEKLAQSFNQKEATIKTVYSGRQDKDYGTCGDMSLIMLELLSVFLIEYIILLLNFLRKKRIISSLLNMRARKPTKI